VGVNALCLPRFEASEPGEERGAASQVGLGRPGGIEVNHVEILEKRLGMLHLPVREVRLAMKNPRLVMPVTRRPASSTTRWAKSPSRPKPVRHPDAAGRRGFPSGLRPLPQFVDAVVWIKRSATMTHKETGRLEARLADAIVKAADEVLGGQHRDQFIVDVYRAGAGTSHNMNV
jgi:hypothetical protein